MSSFIRIFVISIAVTAAASLVPAAFAQTPGAAAAEKRSDIQRAADFVNLMRTVLDPNPDPVLVSPAERAVSGKTTADPASSLATTVPVVTMPDIEVPEEKSVEPDTHETAAQEPSQFGAAVPSSKKDADEADSDDYPPFSYVFFFGEYVPYFEGWYYYSDRWLWGMRWPAPPEPPGWIPPLPPPPPPPRPRPPDPVRPDIGPGPRPGIAGNGDGSASGRTTARPSASATQKNPNEPGSTIPVVPSRHRIPRKNETKVEPLPKDSRIPVAPDQHRFPGKMANQIDFPEKDDPIPVAPGQHRIPGRAAGQNSAPQKNSSIPVAPGAHRIPRSNR